MNVIGTRLVRWCGRRRIDAVLRLLAFLVRLCRAFRSDSGRREATAEVFVHEAARLHFASIDLQGVVVDAGPGGLRPAGRSASALGDPRGAGSPRAPLRTLPRCGCACAVARPYAT